MSALANETTESAAVDEHEEPVEEIETQIIHEVIISTVIGVFRPQKCLGAPHSFPGDNTDFYEDIMCLHGYLNTAPRPDSFD